MIEEGRAYLMRILEEVLKSIVPIFAIILIGFLLQKKRWFRDGFAENISKLIMKIALPASVFTSVVSHLSASKLASFADGLLIAGAAVMISYVAAFAMAGIFRVKSGRRGIFINTFANANTIFIGMPLNLALFGAKAEEYFLVYYVINTISTWAFGSFLITGDPLPENRNPGHVKRRGDWRQILSPPLLAFLIAMLLVIIEAEVPAPLITTAQYLGELVTPLALLYIGIVLCNAGTKALRFDRDTVLALIGKFVIAPASMIAVILLVTRAGYAIPSLELSTLVMQSAVPALTVLPVLAHEGRGDVRYATGIVALSTLLFVLAAPAVMAILQML
jgi:auxin efflux carrier (AEC)